MHAPVAYHIHRPHLLLVHDARKTASRRCVPNGGARSCKAEKTLRKKTCRDETWCEKARDKIWREEGRGEENKRDKTWREESRREESCREESRREEAKRGEVWRKENRRKEFWREEPWCEEAKRGEVWRKENRRKEFWREEPWRDVHRRIRRLSKDRAGARARARPPLPRRGGRRSGHFAPRTSASAT